MITGENIKRLRKKYNLTQTELANKIDRTLRTVQKYEAGEILPPVDIIYKINDIFGGEFMIMFEIEEKEMVDHPSHYNMGEYEAIDVIEDWNLNFNLGNAVKYISRAGHKDNIVQDLKKAMWYLDREIQRLENK
jgi:transcriptional regulator with XRE-family HTH domain